MRRQYNVHKIIVRAPTTYVHEQYDVHRTISVHKITIRAPATDMHYSKKRAS